jgi:predicted N-acetyltransferase YhbS
MGIEIRQLVAGDIDAAAVVNRQAFGAFLELEDPMTFRIGADVIGPRARCWPEGALVITVDGKIVGSGLLSHLGSVCLLGPLTVAPDHWNGGFARQIMGELIAIAETSKFEFTGLFTFPQSPKHVRLYESFGFSLQRITAIMSKIPETRDGARGAENVLLFSEASEENKKRLLQRAREIANKSYSGLDLSREIISIDGEKLGETIFIELNGEIIAFACCHFGESSEATRGEYFIKFAASNPGREAEKAFNAIVKACDNEAKRRGADRLVAGISTGRTKAYQTLQDLGLKVDWNGVSMMRPETDGFNRADLFMIDDWR